MEDGCLFAHNLVRPYHNAPTMVWDSGLADSALEWAQHLALTNTFAHATYAERNEAGENLYSSTSSGTNNAGCANAVYAWLVDDVF